MGEGLDLVSRDGRLVVWRDPTQEAEGGAARACHVVAAHAQIEDRLDGRLPHHGTPELVAQLFAQRFRLIQHLALLVADDLAVEGTKGASGGQTSISRRARLASAWLSSVGDEYQLVAPKTARGRSHS